MFQYNNPLSLKPPSQDVVICSTRLENIKQLMASFMSNNSVDKATESLHKYFSESLASKIKAQN